MKSTTLAHIAALFTVSVWAITFVCTKVLLDYLTPFQILLCRTVLGFVALCLVRPRILRLQERSHELLLAAAGLTGAFGYYLAENTALQFADASFTSIAVSTAPLFTSALSFTVLKERGFGLRFAIGFVVAFLGIVLISLAEGPAHASPPGVVLCLVAAVAWAVYSIIVKRLSNLGYETIGMTKRIFAWGLAFMVVFLLASGDSVPVQALTEPIVAGNLVFLGVVASAACFVTWGYSVKHLGPTLASAYIYLQVPISVLFAVILLAEPMNVPIALGIVLVIVGLAISEEFDRRVVEQFGR